MDLEQSIIEARSTWHVKYVNDPKIARTAASSDSTSSADLILLASSQHIFVREAVAQNQHTPFSILTALFPSEFETEYDIRMALSVVYNPVHGADFILETVLMIRNNLVLLDRLDYYQIILIHLSSSQ